MQFRPPIPTLSRQDTAERRSPRRAHGNPPPDRSLLPNAPPPQNYPYLSQIAGSMTHRAQPLGRLLAGASAPNRRSVLARTRAPGVTQLRVNRCGHTPPIPGVDAERVAAAFGCGCRLELLAVVEPPKVDSVHVDSRVAVVRSGDDLAVGRLVLAIASGRSGASRMPLECRPPHVRGRADSDIAARAGGAGGTALRRRQGGPGSCAFEDRVRGCSAGLAAALANGTSTTVDRCATWNAVRRSRLLIDAGNWAGRACPRRGCTCQLAAGTASATKTVQRRCCCTSPPAPPREAYFEGLARGLDDFDPPEYDAFMAEHDNFWDAE